MEARTCGADPAERPPGLSRTGGSETRRGPRRLEASGSRRAVVSPQPVGCGQSVTSVYRSAVSASTRPKRTDSWHFIMSTADSALAVKRRRILGAKMNGFGIIFSARTAAQSCVNAPSPSCCVKFYLFGNHSPSMRARPYIAVCQHEWLAKRRITSRHTIFPTNRLE